MDQKAQHDASKQQPRRFVKIACLSTDAEMATLVRKVARIKNIRTHVSVLPTVKELLERLTYPPDVLVFDISDECDAASFLLLKEEDALADCEFIVLCSLNDAAYWKEMVLQGEINDYFIGRPLHDPGYLEVQVWRAIERSALHNHLHSDATKTHSSSSETHQAVPGSTKRALFSGKRALLIEDDIASAEVVQDMLDAEGMQVHRASSVKDAYSKFNEAAFDVLLVDLILPGVSGAAAIRMVRENANWSEAPIIITTAHSEGTLVRDCIDRGASSYVIKPVTRRKLLPRIAVALGMDWST